jgi:hypothetical protein
LNPPPENGKLRALAEIQLFAQEIQNLQWGAA